MEHFDNLTPPTLQQVEVIDLYFDGAGMDLEHFAPVFDKFPTLQELRFQRYDEDDICTTLNRSGDTLMVSPQPTAWKERYGL